MANQRIIDFPEAPLTSETSSEPPGTPNSAITSLSTLSTTAIKDGHFGNSLPPVPSFYGHQHRPSSNTLETERADRISRLAGLERVSAGRYNQNKSQDGVGPVPFHGGQAVSFGTSGNMIQANKKSTAGNASATESRTATWASSSARGDDLLNVDTTDDRDRSSASVLDEDLDPDHDYMSDNKSLVGFGEGAGSTDSGPIYVTSRGTVLQNQSNPTTPLGIDTERQKREAALDDTTPSVNSNSSYFDTICHSEGKKDIGR